MSDFQKEQDEAETDSWPLTHPSGFISSWIYTVHTELEYEGGFIE